jgi:hypothetical protein
MVCCKLAKSVFDSDDSAPIKVLLLEVIPESNTTNIARIPIAPTHCVRDLHIRIDLGRLSKSTKIVDPVVVRPETPSKKA